MASRKLELVGADSSENQIRIEIQDEQEISHDGIHTIQLQSPGGSSHFVKGLVVTNPSGNSISSTGQLQSDMSHGHTMLGSEIFLQDRSITLTDASSLGDETTGQIIQMVRLGTDENGETIIFVQPHEGQDQEMQPEVILPTMTAANKSDPLAIDISVRRSELCSLDAGMEESSNAEDSTSNSKVEEDSDVSESEDDEDIPTRRCVVCLRRRKFTEDIFDSSKQLYVHIDVLIAHLNIQVKGTPANTGLCHDCMNYLQRWHVFHCAVTKRHDEAGKGINTVEGKLDLTQYEGRVYRNFKKIARVQEIFNGATHCHYARRHLTKTDWDYFCDHLFHANYIKSEKAKELEKFISSREKLSKLFCLTCQMLIPNGKKGYENHMQQEHQQSPVLYPCDICGKTFTEGGVSTERYLSHWVSHYYCHKCHDCGKGFRNEDDLDSHQRKEHNNGFCDEENMQDSQDEEEDRSPPTKKRKRQSINIAKRQRYDQKISQIKTLMENSSYQHLLRRELNGEKLEYIAERLLQTKSNSSNKMKEIESLTFSNSTLKSVFCEDCRKSIPGGKAGFFDHMTTVHQTSDEDLRLPCDICGNCYPEKDLTGLSKNYFPHWISHFYFEQCTFCSEKFPNATLLRKHSLQHQKRPGYPCPQCDKVLSKKTTLEQHIKTHLPEEEKKKNGQVCPECGKTITAPSLKAHMFSVHSDERPWKCEVCGARFKHKSDLNGHRNAVHLKIKKYTCNICGKSFGHHCGLRVHIMSHEDKRNHSCPTCGKRFITMWHLKKHILTHKEVKDIICPTCGKGFKKEESLQEHMTIHTGEMPYECHICGRKVRVLSNLYKHFMVHKKNKTYYSKKDGPDPFLEQYAGDQEPNPSQSNNASNDKKVPSKRKDKISLKPTPTEDMAEQPDAEELRVNRSSKSSRPVTYRRRGNKAQALKDAAAVAITPTSSQFILSSAPPENFDLRLVTPEEDGNNGEHPPMKKIPEESQGQTLLYIVQEDPTIGWPRLGPVILETENDPTQSDSNVQQPSQKFNLNLKNEITDKF